MGRLGLVLEAGYEIDDLRLAQSLDQGRCGPGSVLLLAPGTEAGAVVQAVALVGRVLVLLPGWWRLLERHRLAEGEQTRTQVGLGFGHVLLVDELEAAGVRVRVHRQVHHHCKKMFFFFFQNSVQKIYIHSAKSLFHKVASPVASFAMNTKYFGSNFQQAFIRRRHAYVKFNECFWKKKKKIIFHVMKRAFDVRSFLFTYKVKFQTNLNTI